MIVAIVQSNYIPWKGYFDLINMADKFIILDDVQYTKRDWRNRNRIKTPHGLKWLTIPVQVKGNYYQKINETKISDETWGEKHWKSVSYNYMKSEYFIEYREIFEELYLNSHNLMLSLINYHFIRAINDLMGCNTEILWSHDFHVSSHDKSGRIMELCRAVGATTYLSGPSAKNYLNEELFRQEKISIMWMDYSGYPIYKQLYGKFIHEVSILDLLFNEGRNASKFMKSFNEPTRF